MELIALRRFDNVKAGETIRRSGHVAQQLIDRRLARAAPTPENKMAPAPQNQMLAATSGKAPPAGPEQPSSASPAAPLLLQTTASEFELGVSPAKPRRRKGDGSSSSTLLSG